MNNVRFRRSWRFYIHNNFVVCFFKKILIISIMKCLFKNRSCNVINAWFNTCWLHIQMNSLICDYIRWFWLYINSMKFIFEWNKSTFSIFRIVFFVREIFLKSKIKILLRFCLWFVQKRKFLHRTFFCDSAKYFVIHHEFYSQIAIFKIEYFIESNKNQTINKRQN